MAAALIYAPLAPAVFALEGAMNLTLVLVVTSDAVASLLERRA